LKLLSYLFPFPENNTHVGVVSQLKQNTFNWRDYIPAMNKELEVVSELEEKTTQLMSEILPATKKALTPEEVAKFSYMIGSWVIYINYRFGYSILRKKIVLEGENISDYLNRRKGMIGAFIEIKINKGQPFYMEEDFPDLALFVVDFHDNSILRDYLKKRDNTHLLTYVPEEGLKEILFNKEKEIEKEFEQAIRRKAFQRICLISNLASRVNPQKLYRYYDDIFSSAAIPYIG